MLKKNQNKKKNVIPALQYIQQSTKRIMSIAAHMPAKYKKKKLVDNL